MVACEDRTALEADPEATLTACALQHSDLPQKVQNCACLLSIALRWGGGWRHAPQFRDIGVRWL